MIADRDINKSMSLPLGTLHKTQSAGHEDGMWGHVMGVDQVQGLVEGEGINGWGGGWRGSYLPTVAAHSTSVGMVKSGPSSPLVA